MWSLQTLSVFPQISKIITQPFLGASIYFDFLKINIKKGIKDSDSNILSDKASSQFGAKNAAKMNHNKNNISKDIPAHKMLLFMPNAFALL